MSTKKKHHAVTIGRRANKTLADFKKTFGISKSRFTEAAIAYVAAEIESGKITFESLLSPDRKTES